MSPNSPPLLGDFAGRAPVEEWLETKRRRGYAVGGATSESGSQAELGSKVVGGLGSSEAVGLLRRINH